MIANVLPKSLTDNPRLDRWLRFSPDGGVFVSVGKVEIGQGISTALAQIAAEELDVPIERLSMRAGDTDAAPDEGMTSGSMSIEMGGASLRLVCAQARAVFVAAAAARLGCAASAISVVDGAMFRDGMATGESYGSLSGAVSLAREATGDVPPKPRQAHRVVGTSVRRLDLPEKLAGRGFLQDLVLPGMVHARIVRQPRDGARLVSLDVSGVEVVRRGDFVALVAARETDVRRALARARAVWEGADVLDPAQGEAAWLRGQPSEDRLHGPPASVGAGRRVRREYTKPYISHGSMGPSCAVAQMVDGHLTVWTHSQGVYPLRAIIAAVLRLQVEDVSLRHVPGAGCYGHNGADDAAIDAATVAVLRPGAPVRVQWQREDEFGFAPVGPAMLVAIEAEVDAAGFPVDWTTEFWSGQHVNRGTLAATSLAVRALPDPPDLPGPTEASDPYPGAGTRNVVPLYDLPAMRYAHHLVRRPPVRTSALRGLGAVAHVFAIESFIDELADAAGVDPVAYRLRLLGDARARALIEAVAEMSGWARRGAAGSGVGLGIGFARYKNRSGAAAVVAEVEADAAVRVRRVWCAGDAGLAINPDGVAAQLEGGVVQATSWALKERVVLDAGGIASRDWVGYPILRFSEVPEVTVRVMESGDAPPVGMGEASVGPTVAAIGNALAHALGARVRDLPFTRDRVAGALLR